VCKVRCGSSHTILLLKDRRVLVAGSNSDRQLGLRFDKTKIIREFTELNDFGEEGIVVEDVSAGVRHSVVLDTRDQLHFFGETVSTARPYDYLWEWQTVGDD